MNVLPKKIHYCWFGRGEIPEKEKNCIATWKKFFPDYELCLWNEDNFDYQDCSYAKQAYEAEKYAFVSDYARAKILYEQGGLYLDTDMKIIRPFPQCDNYNGYIAFDRKSYLAMGVIAVIPKHPAIGELLLYYQKHEFMEDDGSYDIISNASVFTDIMKERGLTLGGEEQVVDGFYIFKREIFYPKKIDEETFNVTGETCAIHLGSGSWMTERERKRGNNKIWIEIIRPTLRCIRSIGIKLIGKERIRKLEIKLRNYLR